LDKSVLGYGAVLGFKEDAHLSGDECVPSILKRALQAADRFFSLDQILNHRLGRLRSSLAFIRPCRRSAAVADPVLVAFQWAQLAWQPFSAIVMVKVPVRCESIPARNVVARASRLTP
jgi:hypothetical protein